MAIFPGSAIPSAVSDYEIDNSLRFNRDDAAYLAKTFSVDGNRKKWTISTWVKITDPSTNQNPIVGVAPDANNAFTLAFQPHLDFYNYVSGSGYVWRKQSSAVYRDVGAWMHVVAVLDTDNGTAEDRARLYVNGERITAWDTDSDPSSGYAATWWNDASYEHRIGNEASSASFKNGNYLAEFYCIDGSALGPDSFGSLDSDTNMWKPLDSDDVKDAVTFGTNGFFQKYNSTELANSFTDSVKYIVTSFTTVESTTWTAPTGVTSVDYLVVAGGGEGGYDAGGGGGAGGYRTGTLSVTPGSSYTVTVGAGGTSTQSGSSKFGADGANSVFSSITSTGGGGAGSTSTSISGRTGGSGGGGGGYNASGGSGGAGNAGGYSPVEGYVGGAGASGATAAGGGGGGSSGAGAAGGSPTNAGGAGTSNSITGSAVTYAAGGTGNSDSSGSNTSGAANTGNGGNGGAGTPQGGAGGSGIVVVRYLSSSGTVSRHTITANGDATNQRPQHHNVTANGDAHLIGPKVGASVFHANSSGDYIGVPSSSDWAWGTGDFTVEGWFNVKEGGHNELMNCGGEDWRFAVESNGKPSWNHSGSGAELTSSTTVASNTWFHLAVSRSSGTSKMFLDGVEVDSASDTHSYVADALTIGSYSTGSYGMDGYAEQIRISDVARYTSAFTPSTDVLTNDSDTQLLITNGTDGTQTFDDLSTSDHTLTANGDVRWFAPKVGAGAMAFDGTGDYFKYGTDVADFEFGAGDFTVECWMQKDSGSSYEWDNCAIAYGDNTAAESSWKIYAPDYIEGYVWSGTTAYNVTATTDTDDNAWHHVALARDGATLRLYIDGTQEDTVSVSGVTLNSHSSAQMVVGWDAGSAYYTGYLDDVRVSSFCRYPDGTTFTPSTTMLTDDINTVLLLNADINQGTWAEDTSTGLAISTDSRMKFDGGDDSLSVADSSDWEFGSGDFCIEAWVNVNENTSTHTIWSTTNLDDYGGMFCNVGAAAGLYWYIGTGSGHITITAPALSAGRWYHVACVRSGTGSNETIIYVDGVSAATGTYTDNSQDAGANGFYVGDWPPNSWDLNGYVDEVRVSNVERYSGTFTPKARGETFTADANTKLLIHSDYTGGLGADSSGNYNNFTATNLVATDQMIDTPSNNFATLNPLFVGDEDNNTLAEGNLQITMTSDNYSQANFGVSSGKWYWECYIKTITSTYGWIGVAEVGKGGAPQASIPGSFYESNHSGGRIKVNGTYEQSGVGTVADGDIVGVALDMDASPPTIAYYKNNSQLGSTEDLTSGLTYTAFTGSENSSTTKVFVYNFGADSSFAGNTTAQGNGGDDEDFYYTPVANHVAYNTKNLPDPEIKLPGEYMDTALFTGTGSELEVSSLSFQPDFTWIKTRQLAYNHRVFDVARGVTKELYTNDSDTEVTDAQSLKSFDSDGFTLGTSSGVNPSSSSNMVSWNWKAGGAPTATNSGGQTPTSGSVMIDGSASTASLASADIYPEKMSINTTSGFSIISYEGNGSSSQTIPHGLSTAPALIISKGYSTGADYNWRVFGENIGLTSANYSIRLDLNNDENDNSNVFGTYPTSSVWTIGSDAGVNDSGKDYIVYCFSNIEGYSKILSFTGNNNADGPFLYTGFKTSVVIGKCVGASGGWAIIDSARNTYNVAGTSLYPNTNDTEETSTTVGLDFLSNGIKVRTTSGSWNQSDTMLVIAFAESPFKYSNAR